MKFHSAPLLVCTALVLLPGEGCRESESPPAPLSQADAFFAPSADSAVRVHWTGMKQIGITANAFYFMRLWNLTASRQLEVETLNKLATAPWRFLSSRTQVKQETILRFRPLLDDLVQEESYLEIRQAPGQGGELVFAIRLSDDRAAMWKTNLAGTLKSLTGAVQAVGDGRGWLLRTSDPPDVIELVRAGEWTLVGAARNDNAFLDTVVGRIRRAGVPFLRPEAAAGTNYWLEAEFDPARFARAFRPGWTSAAAMPKLSLKVTGDGVNCLERADLIFPQALQIQFEPWAIPTNLIHLPISGFTTVRGFKPWLSSLQAWNDLHLGEPPNQLYLWDPGDLPLQTYLSAPLPQAGNQVAALRDLLLEKANPWLAARRTRMGVIQPLPESNGATWSGLPLVSPCFRSVSGPDGPGVFAALLSTNSNNSNPPPLFAPGIFNQTNLLCYDWENTEERLLPWLYLSQGYLSTIGQPQLPPSSAEASWLYAITARLSDCRTTVMAPATNQLTLERRSRIGLSAPELLLLANWLQSPQFPGGLLDLFAVRDQ